MAQRTDVRTFKKIILGMATFVVIIGISFAHLNAENYPEKKKIFDVTTFADFAAAVNNPRTVGSVIAISREISVGTLTIPENRTLQVLKGGRISLLSGGTLTVNGSFVADQHQIFAGTGRVVFGKGSVHEFYPQWWGSVADGVTDCYAALKSMAATVSASGGGKVIFPKGTYSINQFKISDGPRRNDVTDIIFENCSELQISGVGARINVMGSFNRSADVQKKRFFYSYSNSVVPLKINNCSNVVIDGLELNGNVDKMTRDFAAVAESSGHGISIAGGSGVTIKNVNVHHFQSDGIYLSGYNANNIISLPENEDSQCCEH